MTQQEKQRLIDYLNKEIIEAEKAIKNNISPQYFEGIKIMAKNTLCLLR